MGNRARRRRSSAITLVLAGSATLVGCDAPVEQRDAYASVADCVKDWNDAAQCQPVSDGRFSRYYYGPPYFGASLPDGRPRPSPHAMDAVRLSSAASGTASSRSWFRSSSSSSSVSRSSSSGSSSTSRGGFGSTGRSFSSSGS